MDQLQRSTSQADEDGFSQFFVEPASVNSNLEFEISADAQEVLAKLLDAYRKLRAASYRIGYLEGRLLRYRKLSATLSAHAVARRPESFEDKRLPQLKDTRSSVPAGEVERFVGTASIERRRGMAIPRGKILSGSNYYALIRQGLNG